MKLPGSVVPVAAGPTTFCQSSPITAVSFNAFPSNSNRF
jgi:hypothetical protein